MNEARPLRCLANARREFLVLQTGNLLIRIMLDEDQSSVDIALRGHTTYYHIRDVLEVMQGAEPEVSV